MPVPGNPPASTLTAWFKAWMQDVVDAIADLVSGKADDTAVVHDTGAETIAGVKTFSSDPIIPDEAYGAGWNGSLEPATKNAVYDKIETLGGGSGITFKQTIYTGTTNPTTSSTTFGDIDATLYPALSLTLAIGDVVDLSFQATFKGSIAGHLFGVDWLIDQPTSADTTIRASGSKAAAWLYEWPSSGNDAQTLNPRATFVATEAGAHTFKPQWRRFGASLTVTINNTDANYFTTSIHRVTNLGAVTA